MLEAFVLLKVYDKFNKKKQIDNYSNWGGKKEHYGHHTMNDRIKNENNSTVTIGGFFGIFFLIIFFLLLGIPLTIGACYLSWESNTLIEWGTGFKVLFAFFAFLSPFSYLLSHLIHKYDLLTYIKKQKTGHIFNNIQ